MNWAGFSLVNITFHSTICPPPLPLSLMLASLFNPQNINACKLVMRGNVF